MSFSPTSYDERAAMPLGDAEIGAQVDARFEKDNRIGWPKNSLLSWPVRSELVQDSTSATLSAEVQKIMNKAGWSVLVYVSFRYHGAVAGNKTLLVESMDTPPNVDEWKKLLVQIRIYLYSCREHCTIEMFQRDWFYQQPIRIDEYEILEAWTTQSRAFLEILHTEDFTSLELLRISTQSAKAAQTARPRVLVCSPLVDSLQWDVVRTELQASLLSTFDLEFQYSNGLQSQYCLDYQRGEADVTNHDHDRYSATVKMGASIGISGGDGGGTAGAKLSLFVGTSEEDFVLTNNHVIECETKTAVEQHAALTPEHSLVTGKKVQLVSPADADWIHDRNVTFKDMIQLARMIGSRIGYSDSQLLQTEGEIQRQEPEEQVVQTLQQKLLQMKAEYLKGLLAQLQDYQHSGADIGQFGKDVAIWSKELFDYTEDKGTIEEDGSFEKRYLGHLWAASGHRVTYEGLNEGPGWLLDWALGKISETRDISNRIPFFSKGSEVGRQLKLHEKATANQYQDGVEKMAVAKHGRTTGWTVAVINQAAVFIKSDKPTTVGRETATSHGVEVVSDEIVDKYRGLCRALAFFNHDDHFQGTVMKPGDSGSIVLANETSFSGASWVGLAFASSTDSRRGYMMPIEVVLRDIEKVTECSISMPREKQ
ncbi:hypothetical protein BDV96DRAFT_645672 [Lophiotrema nucula]|uniref:Uncharacterized protein n=1 Tax=Lophiotrema nucula TaxID=690887 RepID=A0A6A5ZA74_9PLEO|nr:hypothetical protein BDV96DRAFT_645672 [Lophiotrema nucula]